MVLLDGIDLSLYDRKWLRRQMAIVSQEPVLYARSVRRNICFGVEAEDGLPPAQQPTQSDVEHAARCVDGCDVVGYRLACCGGSVLTGRFTVLTHQAGKCARFYHGYA